MKKWEKTVFDVEFEKAKAGVLAKKRMTRLDEIKDLARKKAQKKYGRTKSQKVDSRRKNIKKTAKKIDSSFKRFSKWADKNISTPDEMSKRLKKL